MDAITQSTKYRNGVTVQLKVITADPKSTDFFLQVSKDGYTLLMNKFKEG